MPVKSITYNRRFTGGGLEQYDHEEIGLEYVFDPDEELTPAQAIAALRELAQLGSSSFLSKRNRVVAEHLKRIGVQAGRKILGDFRTMVEHEWNAALMEARAFCWRQLVAKKGKEAKDLLGKQKVEDLTDQEFDALVESAKRLKDQD